MAINVETHNQSLCRECSVLNRASISYHFHKDSRFFTEKGMEGLKDPGVVDEFKETVFKTKLNTDIILVWKMGGSKNSILS